MKTMTLPITAEDIARVKRAALTRVAISLNIKEIDLKSNFEVSEEIKNLSESYWTLLNNFLTAYEDWFQFYSICNKQDRPGQRESEKLQRLTEKRDLTRSELTKILMLQ